MVDIGVIGYGYWGPNLVRNFAETAGARVTRVADLDDGRLAKVRERYPAIRTHSEPRELLRATDVDAVVVATPVSTHFELAMEALRNGKHVLVEKPLARTSHEAALLIEEAERRGLTLMVDHTFVYTDAVAAIRRLLADGEIGDFYYYDSVRINLGLFQHDVDVVWDLAVHDLAIMDHALPVRPVAVSATGISHLRGQAENVAYITLFFPGRQIAHLHVNWLAPVKIRKTLVGGSRKMIVYDDLEPSEKIKIYDRGVSGGEDADASPESVYRMLVDYRIGDMRAPYLANVEALRREARHFVDCIESRQPCLTDGAAGHRVVRILEAATESMRQRGAPVEIGARNDTRGERRP